MEAWVACAMSWLAGLLGRYKGRRRWSREEVAQMVATLERLREWAKPYPEMGIWLLEVIQCLQEGRWADAKRGFLACWGYYMALREMEARAREQAEVE
jgi:hypothetical protein